jgi:hypothetical protein
VGTHKIKDGMFICKTKGTFAHRDFSAEYKEDGAYKGFWYETFTEISSLFKTDYDVFQTYISFLTTRLPVCFQGLAGQSSP